MPNVRRCAPLIEVARASAKDPSAYDAAMAGFLDTFYTQPARRQAMIEPEPELTGKAHLDAFLATVAEHLARRWTLSIPTWTFNPARTLHEPFFATSIEALKPLLLVQSPLAFRKRMIFVEHEPLSRARMPRG